MGEDTMVSEHSPSEGPARVLVVEDDVTVSEVVERYLKREGFEVECVSDGVVALERAGTTLPDLVILDIMLPGMDGLEVCRKLRAKAPIPIIMLTALGEENDRVMGLELGADDYIAKPFSPRELTARVKSVLRRARGPLHSTAPELRAPVTVGDLQVDIPAREVTIRGRPVALTAREFELLAWFVLHPRHVFTREDLLAKVWGYTFGDESTVTVHVRRLREKVESNPTDPNWIKTVWGVGYRFDP
jgi:DNA-binding response OmpR family regulator